MGARRPASSNPRSSGCADGQWISKPAGSSFFPDNWTPKQVSDTIHEAFANGQTAFARNEHGAPTFQVADDSYGAIGSLLTGDVQAVPAWSLDLLAWVEDVRLQRAGGNGLTGEFARA